MYRSEEPRRLPGEVNPGLETEPELGNILVKFLLTQSLGYFGRPNIAGVFDDIMNGEYPVPGPFCFMDHAVRHFIIPVFAINTIRFLNGSLFERSGHGKRFKSRTRVKAIGDGLVFSGAGA